MRRNLLVLVLLFVAYAFTGYAQELTIELAEGEESFTKSADIGNFEDTWDIPIHSYVRNNTDQPIQVLWERYNVEFTNANWENYICDANNCWPSTTDAPPADFLISIPPGEKVLFDVHFRAKGESGEGTMEVLVYNANNPNMQVTQVHKVQAWVTGIDDPAQNAEPSIYPNPVRSELNIDFGAASDVSYVEVFNLIGKKIGAYTIPNNQFPYTINALDFDEGMYFVSMYNDAGELKATKVFSKVR